MLFIKAKLLTGNRQAKLPHTPSCILWGKKFKQLYYSCVGYNSCFVGRLKVPHSVGQLQRTWFSFKKAHSPVYMALNKCLVFFLLWIGSWLVSSPCRLGPGEVQPFWWTIDQRRREKGVEEEDGEGGTHLEEGKVIHQRSELVQIPARSSIRSIEPCSRLQEVHTGWGLRIKVSVCVYPQIYIKTFSAQWSY